MIKDSSLLSIFIAMAVLLSGCESTESKLNKAYVQASQSADAAISAKSYSEALGHYEKTIVNVELILEHGSSDLAVELVAGEKKLGGKLWSAFSKQGDELRSLADAEGSLEGASDYLLSKLSHEDRFRTSGKMYVIGDNLGYVPYERIEALESEVTKLADRLRLLTALVSSDLNTIEKLRTKKTSTDDSSDREAEIVGRALSNMIRLEKTLLAFLEDGGSKYRVISSIRTLSTQPLFRDAAWQLYTTINQLLEKIPDDRHERLELLMYRFAVLFESPWDNREAYRDFYEELQKPEHEQLGDSFLLSAVMTFGRIDIPDMVRWSLLSMSGRLDEENAKATFFAAYFSQKHGHSDAAKDYAQPFFDAVSNNRLSPKDDYEGDQLRSFYGFAAQTALVVDNQEALKQFLFDLQNMRLMMDRSIRDMNLNMYHQRKALYGILDYAGEYGSLELINKIDSRLGSVTNSSKEPQAASNDAIAVAKAFAEAGYPGRAEQMTPEILKHAGDIKPNSVKATDLYETAIIHRRFEIEMSAQSKQALARFVQTLRPIDEFWSIDR